MADDARTKDESAAGAPEPRYRVQILSPDGRMVEAISFTAYGDEAASVIAKSMIDGHAIELWNGRRLINRFEPEDG